MKDTELEIKFFINDLEALRRKLQGMGAELVQPRTHEINLRFDTPDGRLGREFRVLRLRQDEAVRLTYKGPGVTTDGVRVRQEIEFSVSSFEAARAFLLALDYQVAMMYEKYRTTYDLDQVHVTLDEMPYGHFAELEGPDVASIQAVCGRLELDWSAGVQESYVALFDRLRWKMNLGFTDLSFNNFSGLAIEAGDLEVRAADGAQPAG